MTELRRILVLAFLSLIVFHRAPSAQAQVTSQPWAEAASTDVVLDGHTVINMVPDFLDFWEEASTKPLRVQRSLWTRMVENKYRDYFDRAVYRGADPETRREMLDRFLLQVPARIDRLSRFNMIAADSVVQGLVAFKSRFPDYQQQRDIYIGISLFTFDGSVRPVSNSLLIPDTLCLGADVLSSYSPDQLKIAIVHEIFHLYHFRFLFNGIYKLYHHGLVLDRMVLTKLFAPYIPLMVEGMAVAASEEIYPGYPLTMYLHFSEAQLAEQQQNLAANASTFLGMIHDGAIPFEYDKWFNGSYEFVPKRGGYLLGYQVVREAMSGDLLEQPADSSLREGAVNSSSLEQMIKLTPGELGARAASELSSIITSKVFLIASRD
ncbi:MAG TPA: DUF2268 domain-containing putative Zn-dependent protease [Blastocatellia bacterium]|nr:DUF2268 domain-containing putative Zn-dependent protease [Blastocatellia bacterium]